MLVKPKGMRISNLVGVRAGMKFRCTVDDPFVEYGAGNIYIVNEDLRLTLRKDGFYPLEGNCGEFTQIIENPVDLFEYADYVEQQDDLSKQKESA